MDRAGIKMMPCLNTLCFLCHEATKDLSCGKSHINIIFMKEQVTLCVFIRAYSENKDQQKKAQFFLVQGVPKRVISDWYFFEIEIII